MSSIYIHSVTVDRFSFEHTVKPPDFDEKDLRYGVYMQSHNRESRNLKLPLPSPFLPPPSPAKATCRTEQER